jgi:tellurite resistance protein
MWRALAPVNIGGVMGLFKFLAYVAGGVGAATGTPWVVPAVIDAAEAADAATLAGATGKAGKLEYTAVDVARAFGLGAGQGPLTDARHEAMFRRVAGSIQAHHNNEPFIGALFTLAVAVAYIDGEIVAAERQEMDEFLEVIARTGFSTARIAEFRQMYETPPTCEEALACVEAAGISKEIVADLVQLVVDADGKVTVEEFELLAKLSISRPA